MTSTQRTSRSWAPLFHALAATAIVGSLAPAQAQSSPGTASTAATTYVLPGEAVFPEGVAYQPSTGNFYVGSTTDGTIYRGNVRGGDITVFSAGGADGRTTAIGMEVDGRGRLWVAGGGTGKIWVYDTADGKLVKSLATPAAPSTFINDVAVTAGGEAYFTDSMRPILFRVTSNAEGVGEVEAWCDFTGTALEYQQGFNLNGIELRGKDLIVVQSNTGKLFRVGTGDKAVSEIRLEGGNVTAGDGLVLRGNTLLVVRNQLGQIAVVDLSDDLARGKITGSFTDPTFRFPTTAALAGDRLLVVNSQFNKRGEGLSPELPFTVSNVALP